MTLPRHIPEGSTKVEGAGVVMYCYENRRGLPSVICYGGKRNKPDYHYCYMTSEQRDKRVQDTLDAYKARAERLAAQKAEKEALKKVPNPLKVGDLLYSSWGYDQTNVDYYQVVKATKRAVWLRKVASEQVEGTEGFMSCQVRPCKDQFCGEPQIKRVSVSLGSDGKVHCSVKVSSCAYASPCEPDSKHYCSWYA